MDAIIAAPKESLTAIVAQKRIALREEINHFTAIAELPNVSPIERDDVLARVHVAELTLNALAHL